MSSTRRTARSALVTLAGLVAIMGAASVAGAQRATPRPGRAGSLPPQPTAGVPYPGATVLSSYWSWGTQPARRQALLADSWAGTAQRVVHELSSTHPDLPAKVRRVDLMRYGHAMSVPVPGVRSSAALHALASASGRIRFAHGDLSAYSVFEEAYFHGLRAARNL